MGRVAIPKQLECLPNAIGLSLNRTVAIGWCDFLPGVRASMGDAFGTIRKIELHSKSGSSSIAAKIVVIHTD